MSWYKKASNSEQEVKEISHTIVVINDAISETHHIQTSESLLHHVSHLVPDGWEKSPHYMILNDGPAISRQDIGKEVVLTATHLGIDGEVLALTLDSVMDDCPSCDIIPRHLTVAVNKRSESRQYPETWTDFCDVLDDDGNGMSTFTLIGYIGEMTVENEVLFND